MNKILFVDDDQLVLDSLRRMLRSKCDVWEMTFVDHPEAAWEQLLEQKFDAVITDVKMPGLSGLQLLERIKQTHETKDLQVVMLTGLADRGLKREALELGATDLLSKPVEPENLLARIQNVLRLKSYQDELKAHNYRLEEKVRERTAELSHSRLNIIWRLGKAAEHRDEETGMTAKVLQLVSSSFFGTPQRISDAPHAVDLLGPDTIRALFLTTEAFFPFDLENSQEHFFEAQADHSLAVAMAAREIAATETEDPRLVGDAYLSGLLHDIGILVLAKDSPERYLETLALARDERTSLKNAEKISYNATRDDVGAYLMGLWGLPDPIVKVTAYHLSPTRSADQTFGPLAAVHVANAVLEEDVAGMLGMPSPIDGSFLERIGCANRLETWREICRAVTPEGVPQ